MASASNAGSPTSTSTRCVATRPSHSLARTIAATPVLGAILDERRREALARLGEDLSQVIAAVNESILAAELVDRREFFDASRRGRSPRNSARGRYFDNRVQVIAAAGSGKTSVMVARAAYAVDRGFVPRTASCCWRSTRTRRPNYRRRVDQRLAAAGIEPPGEGLDVPLFRTRRHRPAQLAKSPAWRRGWTQARTSRCHADRRRAPRRSATFRYKWDLYPAAFARAPRRPDGGRADGYDGEAGQTGSGLRGRDRQEPRRTDDRRLAVPQRGRVRVRAALRPRRRGRPARAVPARLLLPGHRRLARALGARPRTASHPAEFGGYAEAMAWKRNLHREHGTTLVETTWAEVMAAPASKPAGTSSTRLGLESRLEPRSSTKTPGPSPCETRTSRADPDLHDAREVELAHAGRTGPATHAALEDFDGCRKSTLPRPLLGRSTTSGNAA